MESNYIWNDVKTILLISLTEGHELLYNYRLKDYRDKHKRRAALEEISNELGTTVVEVNRRWNYLRNYFREELNREKKVPEDGQEVHVSRWRFYMSMSFLTEYLQGVQGAPPRRSTKQLKTEEQSDVDEEMDEDTLSSAEVQSPTSPSYAFTPSSLELECTAASPPNHPTTRQVSAQRKRNADTFQESMDSMVEKYIAQKMKKTTNGVESFERKEEDVEAESFGRTVASEFKLVTDPDIRVALKRKLLNLIFDAQSEERQKQSRTFR